MELCDRAELKKCVFTLCSVQSGSAKKTCLNSLCFHFRTFKTVCYMRFKYRDIYNFIPSRSASDSCGKVDCCRLLLHPNSSFIFEKAGWTTVIYLGFVHFRLIKCWIRFFSLGQIQTNLILFHAAWIGSSETCDFNVCKHIRISVKVLNWIENIQIQGGTYDNEQYKIYKIVEGVCIHDIVHDIDPSFQCDNLVMKTQRGTEVDTVL